MLDKHLRGKALQVTNVRLNWLYAFFHPEMSLRNQCQLLHSSSLQGIINTAFVRVKIVLLALLFRINLHISFIFLSHLLLLSPHVILLFQECQMPGGFFKTDLTCKIRTRFQVTSICFLRSVTSIYLLKSTRSRTCDCLRSAAYNSFMAYDYCDYNP